MLGLGGRRPWAGLGLSSCLCPACLGWGWGIPYLGVAGGYRDLSWDKQASLSFQMSLSPSLSSLVGGPTRQHRCYSLPLFLGAHACTCVSLSVFTVITKACTPWDCWGD